MFDMKKPKFFSQLHGSTRNVPNRLVVIDTTVSDKQHILYQLYQASKKGKEKHCFSLSVQHQRITGITGIHMTKTQLDSYRRLYPKQNLKGFLEHLGMANARMFTEEMVQTSNT
jgi:hypothetical protein